MSVNVQEQVECGEWWIFKWEGKKRQVYVYSGKIVNIRQRYYDNRKAGVFVILKEEGKFAELLMRNLTMEAAKALILNKEVKIKFTSDDEAYTGWYIGMDNVTVVENQKK